MLLIVSITKFLIMIGFLHTHFSRHHCPITGVQFELLLLDTHLIYTSITHALKAFLQCL